ncbi:polyketide synthase [Mycolicibacterium sp. CBMA 334]|uniref:polyketide synthase n=1 Tax=Mycolicibacterium sp. CBMA 334 TaxID=2606607 RepID=UPI0012DE21E7|nr:polyketide synthase [Mycolicibacterium sp. CBMA 334]MUL99214.1 polyketide synthase [Mycolicibacterium sp. CBMA 334]
MSVSVLPDASGAGSWIADYGTAGPPRAADMATVSSSLDGVLSAELHAAQITLGCTAEDVLLAALGRTVARTIGEGMLIVDVVSGPEVAGFRRVGVPCVARRGLSGSELLAAARPGAAGDAEAAHPLAVHVHRDSGTTMGLHWRFDTRGFDHCTVQELAEQFPLALIEVTSG